MGKPIDVNNDNFEAEVLSAPIPVVVDFWASWCGPCQMMAPVLEELADDEDCNAKIVKVNVDENQELASKYGIMSIPTMVIFKESQEIGRVVGYMPKEKLKEKLKEIIH
ncbi:MAG: thioredoxin 1 [Clostridia bacterium]|nr:thioredoxin 1 [Clostridia bacterium]